MRIRININKLIDRLTLKGFKKNYLGLVFILFLVVLGFLLKILSVFIMLYFSTIHSLKELVVFFLLFFS